MNTLMNAYNRRAEVAATLTNTMGRQKLGSSPLQPSRAACRKETERRRERERERERESEDEGREEKRKRRWLANEPALFAEKKRDCFTLAGFASGGGVADTRKRLNYFRLATKLSGPAKRPQ